MSRRRPPRIDTAPVVEMSAAAVVVLAIVVGLFGTTVPAEAGQIAQTSCEVAR